VKRLNYINNGGTDVREVSDRKVPIALDPERLRSQERGWTGKGLNKFSMNESIARTLTKGQRSKESK